jgi:CBS domain-containing protein
MKVGDFMTRRVVTVAPDASILSAAQLMLEHKVSGLPVIDDHGRVVGIVSEHDLLRSHDDGGKQPHWLQLLIGKAELADECAGCHDRKVSEVMTRDPVTVTAASPIGEACRLIEDHGIKRLPVVRDGMLVGVIARADLVRALTSAIHIAANTDSGVKARLTELERQFWLNRARSLKQH